MSAEVQAEQESAPAGPPAQQDGQCVLQQGPQGSAGSWDPACSSTQRSELFNKVYLLLGGAIKANPSGRQMSPFSEQG